MTRILAAGIICIGCLCSVYISTSRSIGILHFLCFGCERVSLHCQRHAQHSILHRVSHQRHGPPSVHYIHHYISFQSRSWLPPTLVQFREAKHSIFYHRDYTQASCSCISCWNSVRAGRFSFFLRGGSEPVPKSSSPVSTNGRHGCSLRLA